MSSTRSRLEYQEIKKESILEWLLRQEKSVFRYPVELAVCLLSISLALYHLVTAYAGSPQAHTFLSTHLAFIMVLCFLLKPLGRHSWTAPKNKWFAVDLLLAALTIAVQIYKLRDMDAFIQRQGNLNDLDIFVGTVFLLLLLEATRRAVGCAMVIIASFFLLQTAFSDRFFGIFHGRPGGLFTIIDYLFMREKGIYGIPLMVTATYIFLFILLGAILMRSGAGRFFINVAMALTGSKTGGPAKASVVSSCLMASVSGSAVANVVTTGTFTIPLMKRVGYRSYFAGAVETCASSGSQIMPPVMGVAGFVIAEFLDVTYLQVAKAAIFPALIYFFSIFLMVHFEARRKNLSMVSKEELPVFKTEMKLGWHLFLPILLIVALMVVGYKPMFAALCAIFSILVLGILRRETRMSPVQIFSAFEEGARQAVSVSIACAAAGLILGCVSISSLDVGFSTVLMDVAAGNPSILLIIIMLTSFILGLALTAIGTYITIAALVIPAAVNTGVDPMAAHLFAFYFCLVSAVKNPAAMTPITAAGVAKAPLTLTVFHSFRLGIAKCIIPFMFVLNPAILFAGDWLSIFFAVACGFGAMYALTVTTYGWMISRVGWPMRIGMAVAAMMMFNPNKLAALAGWAVCGLLVIIHQRRTPGSQRTEVNA